MSTYEFDRNNSVSNTFSTTPDNNLADFSFSTENANISVKDPELYGKTYDYIPGGVHYTIEMQRLADCMEEGDIKGFIKSMLILESIPTACEKPDFKKYLSTTITNAIIKIRQNFSLDDTREGTIDLIENTINQFGIELTDSQKIELELLVNDIEDTFFESDESPTNE